MDEEILENRVEFIDNEMVNDSISEVASKNLSFDGMIDDKSDAFINGISSIHNLLVQLNEIRFVIELEFDGTSGISFVFSAIVVCLEKFGEVHKISRWGYKKTPLKTIYRVQGSFLVLETTHTEAVRPIIVIRRVNSRGIEVQIVTVRRVRTGRPVVAVRPLIVHRTVWVIAVAWSNW